MSRLFDRNQGNADGINPLRRAFLKHLSNAGFFAVAGGLLLPTGALAGAPTRITSTRIWPAEEYTRLTIESDRTIAFRSFTVADPDRLVVDLENVNLDDTLKNLRNNLSADDPYIQQIRVAYFTPKVVRVVLDLKTRVKPSIFTLPPVSQYGHRLVLDIYPDHPLDPLLALVAKPPQGQEVKPLGEDGKLPETQGADYTESAKDADAEKPARKEDSEKAQVASKDKPAGTQPKVDRLITVTIDPGHGGEDPGATGARGTHEKDVTLAIARRVKKIIDQQPNMRAVLTRDGDYFIPLQNRVTKARKVYADLFVSIHADAFMNAAARGSSVFILSEGGASSTAARWLAKKENDADLIGGVNLDVKDPYLARTLLDLSQTATINDSMKLAKSVLKELGEINHLHKGSVEQAGFAVLKAPDIPSILVETAFISNPDEERKLSDNGHQDKVANAIVDGIKRYFAKNPPLARSRLAQRD